MLDRFLLRLKQFCFFDGEAISQEVVAARCGASGKSADAAGAR